MGPIGKKVRRIAERFVRNRGYEPKSLKYIREGMTAAVFEVAQGVTRRALKLYDPDFYKSGDGAIENARIDLQRQLIGHGCPYLVDIVDAGEFENTAYVLMEFVEGKGLDECIATLPRSCIPSLLSQVAKAAKFLHDRGLCHRDIKPANIVISPDLTRAKLLDLGVLRPFDPNAAVGTDPKGKWVFVATAQYSSPEYLFRARELTPEMLTGLTFYQLGAVLYDMLNRIPLFHAEAQSGNRLLVCDAVRYRRPVITAIDADQRLAELALGAVEKNLRRRLAWICWDDFLALGHASAEEEPEIAPRYNRDHVLERTARCAESLRIMMHEIFKENGLGGTRRQFRRLSDNLVVLDVIYDPLPLDAAADFSACLSLELTFDEHLAECSVICTMTAEHDGLDLLPPAELHVGKFSIALWDEQHEDRKATLRDAVLALHQKLLTAIPRKGG